MARKSNSITNAHNVRLLYSLPGREVKHRTCKLSATRNSTQTYHCENVYNSQDIRRADGRRNGGGRGRLRLGSTFDSVVFMLCRVCTVISALCMHMRMHVRLRVVCVRVYVLMLALKSNNHVQRVRSARARLVGGIQTTGGRDGKGGFADSLDRAECTNM